MNDSKKLGAQIGEDFARMRTLGSEQQIEARNLVDQIVARDPKVKLPQILGDDRIKAWQQEKGVSDHNLKEALTQAREALRNRPEEDVIKVPPRKRSRQSAAEAKGERAKPAGFVPGQTANRGMVENRSLDLL